MTWLALHVSYLSPRIDGAKRCCPEHLAACLQISMFFLFLTTSLFFVVIPRVYAHFPSNTRPRTL